MNMEQGKIMIINVKPKKLGENPAECHFVQHVSPKSRSSLHLRLRDGKSASNRLSFGKA
jgi:hypothetical protein